MGGRHLTAPAAEASHGGLPVRLVLDTNVLVSELLRQRGQGWLSRPHPELFVTERVDGEFGYEVQRRVQARVAQGRISEEAAEQIVAAARGLYHQHVTVIPAEQYDALETDARQRIPADPDDWPSVALALLLDCGLWTEDRDFFGCGLSVWQSAVLYAMTIEQGTP